MPSPVGSPSSPESGSGRIESRALLSAVPGGCGKVLPYSAGNEELTASEGQIWCGMRASSLEGYYFVCDQCNARIV